MATEAKIKELFERAKVSKFFAGLKGDDIWKACLDYAGRSDAELDAAMERLNDRDEKIEVEGKLLIESRERKMKELMQVKKLEMVERGEDMQLADALISNLFNH